MNKLSIVLGILVISILITLLVGLTPADKSDDNRQFAQKVNLALRRTAHHLLIAQGDSTSRIPPVRQLNATTFLIRLDKSFNYRQLPSLLQKSLRIHAIKASYDVAVLNCANGELQLGYSMQDITGQGEVPCKNRDQQPGCRMLQITFATPTATSPLTLVWWPWAVGLLLIGGGYSLWRGAQSRELENSAARNIKAITDEDEKFVQVGNLIFNPVNQSVNIAGITHTLTYREAKLLHLFLRHPNQLLQRDFILKSVWEDEGIIVGRSVDVFVSRLRKLLQADPTLRIVAVHGVGYKMEHTS
jgi:hypothetical protein